MITQHPLIVDLVESICDQLAVADAAEKNGDAMLQEYALQQVCELFREYERQVRLRARSSINRVA